LTIGEERFTVEKDLLLQAIADDVKKWTGVALVTVDGQMEAQVVFKAMSKMIAELNLLKNKSELYEVYLNRLHRGLENLSSISRELRDEVRIVPHG